MNITINVQAPELAKAIEALAAALTGKAPILEAVLGQKEEAATQQMPDIIPAAPIQQSQPVSNVVPIQQPVPTYQAPPVNVNAPVQQPQVVPTSAPTYTMDQLAVAATQLMDAGRQPELLALLSSFGVPSLMALPKEQYGTFATKLREMGARI